MKKQTILEYLYHHQCKFNNMDNVVVKEVVDYLTSMTNWWQEEVTVEDLDAISDVQRFLKFKNWYWVEILHFYEKNEIDVEDINQTISSMKEVWLALSKRETTGAWDAILYVVQNSIEHVLKTTIEEIKQLEK